MNHPLSMMLMRIDGFLLQPHLFHDTRVVVDIGGWKYMVPLDDPIRMIEEVKLQEQ